DRLSEEHFAQALLAGEAQRAHRQSDERDDIQDQIEQAGRSPREALKSDRARRQHPEIRNGQRQAAEDQGEDRSPPVTDVYDKLLPGNCDDGVDIHLYLLSGEFRASVLLWLASLAFYAPIRKSRLATNVPSPIRLNLSARRRPVANYRAARRGKLPRRSATELTAALLQSIRSVWTCTRRKIPWRLGSIPQRLRRNSRCRISRARDRDGNY